MKELLQKAFFITAGICMVLAVRWICQQTVSPDDSIKAAEGLGWTDVRFVERGHFVFDSIGCGYRFASFELEGTINGELRRVKACDGWFYSPVLKP